MTPEQNNTPNPEDEGPFRFTFHKDLHPKQVAKVMRALANCVELCKTNEDWPEMAKNMVTAVGEFNKNRTKQLDDS